jgi:hypothetical protein
MDIARLADGQMVELIRDNETVQFAPGKWSLICSPINARFKDQSLRWVRTTAIAQRYSITEEPHDHHCYHDRPASPRGHS